MTSAIDTTVIAVFSLFILGIGVLFARTGKNMKTFFAGGEHVPWFIGGLSLFMSFFSAGTFVAWGSIAYKYGWVAVVIQWTMCLGGIATACFIAPKWKSTGNLTAAEFIGERLGNKVQKFYAYIFLAVSLFSKGSILYPVAKLVSVSLGYPLVPCTIILGLLMIAYTAIGGLWAVMVTDILQFVVLSAAVLLLLPLTVNKAGGMSTFLQNAPEGFLDFTNGEYTWGFILAFALYHICFIGGNWAFVQRYTSVPDTGSARKVALLFAGLYVICPIIWMLPPMLYRIINPGLDGLETENAYLMVCNLVLPPGLMGLMLTGMYFSTSASANTTLNVASAVFTNDIYKSVINPKASDRRLIQVGRMASWAFGIGMIGIALLVPAAGGMVNVVLSISAITGGPLLLPPIWALFSKRLTGKATLIITGLSLGLNLVFKSVLPLITGSGLSRANEMLLGVLFPLILLIICEVYYAVKGQRSAEYENYMALRRQRKETVSVAGESADALKQNEFGLRVICFALAFTALLLFVLCFFTTSGRLELFLIALTITILCLIPYRASKKLRIKMAQMRAVETL